MQRNVDTRIYDDDDLTLYICDRPNPTCLNCFGCPCLEAHTIDECQGERLGCGTCHTIDQFVVDEIEEEMHELYPVIIMDEMPPDDDGFGLWGDISPRTAAYVTADLLERAKVNMLFRKFSRNLKNNFVGSQNEGKTISFRRYGTDVFQQSEKSNDHMIDALRYGMGIQGHSLTGVFYDEAAEIPEGKITGKNPHSETN